MPEDKSSPGCLRNAVIPESSLEPDNGTKAEVTRTTPDNTCNHGKNTQQKQEKLPYISSILENVDIDPMSLWARPQTGMHQEPFGFDEVPANTLDFADIPLTQALFTSTPGTLPSSSLLHKYSNVSGVPQMDSRTVLSSVHDGSSTINSPTTTVTHTCNSPKPFTGIDDHSFLQPYGGKSSTPDPFGLSRSFNINFADPNNPTMSDSGCHLTPADTIFHMHACDDFLTEPLNDSSLFPSYGPDSPDQQNVSSNVLHKLAGGFGRNQFQEQMDKSPRSSAYISGPNEDMMQTFANMGIDSKFSPTSTRSVRFPGSLFGIEPQALPTEYCSNTDAAVLDILFDELSEFNQSPKSDVRGKKDLHIDTTKKKTVESSKVVAELLADLLDDVDDVPYYMNEIESGLTLTPDPKDVRFLCDPNLSLASSWSPSSERGGIDTRDDKRSDPGPQMAGEQKSSPEACNLGLFKDETSKSAKDDGQGFHSNFPYNMPPLSDAFSEPPSCNQPAFMPCNVRPELGFLDIPVPPPPPPPAPASNLMKTPLQLLQGGTNRLPTGQDDVTRKLVLYM